MRRSGRVWLLGFWLLAIGAGRAIPDAAAHPIEPPAGLAHPGDATGPEAGPPPRTEDRGGRGFTLIGSLPLEPAGTRSHADIYAYGHLALIGKGDDNCPGAGIDIVDLADPTRPQLIGRTDPVPRTATEDLAAIRIGDRDILAVGLQDCGVDEDRPGRTGVEFHDLTDPAQPQFLSYFDTGVGGVHELDLTRTPDGRTLALLAVPGLEAFSSDDAGRGGRGDLLILDISDPADPFLLGEWGILDEPTIGLNGYLAAAQGNDPRPYLHSVRASATGSRAYLSYWDAGYLILDLSDPAEPWLIGRSIYAPEDEGNAHSVAEAFGGTLLVAADEDYTPFRSVLESSALAGEQRAVDATFTPPIARLPDRTLAGDLVYVGTGCPAGGRGEGTPADRYFNDPAGRIALIDADRCRFDLVVARAQAAGAIGAIVFRAGREDAPLLPPFGRRTVPLADDTSVRIQIPVVRVQPDVGAALRDARPPVAIRVRAVFDGWGYLRFYDLRDPANPVQVGTYATPNSLDPNPSGGIRTVHNPEVRGTTVFAAWYREGVRAIDIRNPAAPREIGYWTGAGAPEDAPPVDLWGVALMGDLVLVSDFNYGLYVLRPTFK